jgi:hypothetical protein
MLLSRPSRRREWLKRGRLTVLERSFWRPDESKSPALRFPGPDALCAHEAFHARIRATLTRWRIQNASLARSLIAGLLPCRHPCSLVVSLASLALVMCVKVRRTGQGVGDHVGLTLTGLKGFASTHVRGAGHLWKLDGARRLQIDWGLAMGTVLSWLGHDDANDQSIAPSRPPRCAACHGDGDAKPIPGSREMAGRPE